MKTPVKKVVDEYVAHEYPESIDREFRQWLLSDGHASEKEEALESMWAETPEDTTARFDESFERMRRLTGIADRHRVRGMRRVLNVWRAVAAVLLVALGAWGVWFATSQSPVQPDLLQSYIPKAEMSSLTLPDGTEVTLNANSTLLYPQRFEGATRCVYLAGEANFKVKPDEEHPFIVKSSDFQVTALGTEFNVVAYPEDDRITAILLSGKVKVDFDNLSRTAYLDPSQQLVYNRNTRKASKSAADIADATAWQRGLTVMRGLTPDEIFTRLARRYPYTFVYSPHGLSTDRYTLTFDADASLAEVMDITSRVMGNITYRIVDDKCYVSAR